MTNWTNRTKPSTSWTLKDRSTISTNWTKPSTFINQSKWDSMKWDVNMWDSGNSFTDWTKRTKPI
jgi:hypothetical protein